jgi:FtsP/CotA-like multicopper oxidase with cupredoxin domain
MTMLTRRSLLGAGLAFVMAGAAGAEDGASKAGLQRLAVVRRTLIVNGKSASAFAIQQPDGSMGLTLDPGQRFAVHLANQAGEASIIHWHGQTPPVRQDGVADTGLESLIADGSSAGYDFVPRAGTHWMHSHHGLQEQRLMAAPLIVRSVEDARLDAQEVVVLLHDFSFRDPAEIFAGLGGKEMQMGGARMPDDAGMAHHTHMRHDGMAGGGKTGMVMDLNDVAYDAYLANERTLADPQVVRAERNGRVRLRLINGASSTAFWINLGALAGEVIAVDGDAVQPVAVRWFPLAEAQRVDLLLRLPPDGGTFPIMAQREGDRARTGIIIATPDATVTQLAEMAERPAPAVDLSLERQLTALAPLPDRPADIVHRVTLDGQMMPYRWTINGKSFAERVPLEVAEGQRVEIEVVNMTGMAHPMHLHGHHFQVIGLDGTAVRGAMRDTVLVPAQGRIRIAFDADNPGRWLFHCHNLYHMQAGMMTEVAYRGFA